MDFPLKVLGARMVVKLEPEENTTLGGIILPNADKEPINKGHVMAVGDGARLENGTKFPMEVSVDDYIIFSPMAGNPVEIPGDENKYLVINERDVLAIIE